ncbi:MAG TPA: hypothetical protein VK524_34885 [Polyangiaceae bacterium]|nr:hypothetical protein [Polyangiaceae bacterium]
MRTRPLVDDDMVSQRVHFRPKDVVFVKGIFEASEGLGALFAERGGDVILAAPRSRAEEFETLIRDLVADLGAVIEDEERT